MALPTNNAENQFKYQFFVQYNFLKIVNEIKDPITTAVTPLRRLLLVRWVVNV